MRLVAFDESERCGFKNIVVELTENWPVKREITGDLHAEHMLPRPYYFPALHQKRTDYAMVYGDLSATEGLARALPYAAVRPLRQRGRYRIDRCSAPLRSRTRRRHQRTPFIMNTSPNGLALFGAEPALQQPLPIGQNNFPNWERYETAFRDISHGSTTRTMGHSLKRWKHGSRNVCSARHVRNDGQHRAVAGRSTLGVKGKVVVPALSYVQTAQSLAWANVEPVFCDVSAVSGHLTPELVEAHLSDDVTGILIPQPLGWRGGH